MIYFYIVPMYALSRFGKSLSGVTRLMFSRSLMAEHIPATSKRLPQLHVDDKRRVRISKTMSWLLRHGAAQQQLPMRKDGYVCVQDLVRGFQIRNIHASDSTVNQKLRQQKLRGVTFSALEDVVKRDEKQRYHLLYEPQQPESPGASSQSSSWWIRANQGHSLKVRLLHVARYPGLLLRRRWK